MADIGWHVALYAETCFRFTDDGCSTFTYAYDLYVQD